MSKKTFYVSRKVIALVPELKDIIKTDEDYLVGISASGNIKYILNSNDNGQAGDIRVINKKEVPPLVMERLRNVLCGDDAITQGIDSQDAELIFSGKVADFLYPPEILGKIELRDLKILFPDIQIPKACVSGLYIRSGSSSIKFMMKRKKKTKESAFPFKYPETDDAVRDIILRKSKDLEKHEPDITGQIAANKKVWNEMLPSVKKYFYDSVLDAGTFSFEFEGPTLGIRLWRCDNACLTKGFSIIHNFPEKKIYEWIDSKIPSIVNVYNKDNKEKMPGRVIETIKKAIKVFLEKKGLSCVNIQHSTSKKGYYTYNISAKTPNNIPINCTVRGKFVLKKEYIVEHGPEAKGVYTYSLSETGLKEAEVEIKTICDWLLNGAWKVVFSRKTKDLSDLIKKAESPYNEWFEKTFAPLLCKEMCPKIEKNRIEQYTVYNLASASFKYPGPLVEISVLSNGNTVEKATPIYKEAVKEAGMKRFQSAVDFFKEAVSRSGLDIRYFDGKGILYGDTTVNVCLSEDSVQYKWETPLYKDGLVKWKKETARNIKAAIEAAKKREEEEKQQARNILGRLTGDFIAKDAAFFIEKNQGYITKNAVVNYLRGLKQTFGGKIIETDAGGRYKQISSKDVELVIDRMLTDEVIYARILKGTYGQFAILKPTRLSWRLCALDEEPVPTKVLYKKANDGEVLSDVYSEQVFLDICKKEKLSSKDYLIILNLIGAKGFVCKYYDEYVSFFKNAPLEIRQYVAMKKEFTQDKLEKRIYSLIMKGGK